MIQADPNLQYYRHSMIITDTGDEAVFDTWIEPVAFMDIASSLGIQVVESTKIGASEVNFMQIYLDFEPHY